MKKLLMLLAMAAVAFACEPTPSPAPEGGGEEEKPTPEEPKPALSVVGDDVVMFEVEGGQGEIVYTIENPQEGLQLEAVSGESWVSNVVVGETITYLVAENDSQADRRCVITLTYGDLECIYTVLQDAGADVFFTATSLAGSLCTEDYLGEGVHSYSVLLSADGIDEESKSYYLGSDYYVLDLYADKTTYSKTSPIPNGTYTLASGGELTVGSLNAEKSGHLVAYESGVEKRGCLAGEVVVSDGKIVALLTLENGKVHRVEYNGSLEVDVYSMPVTGGFSTLTSDLIFDIHNGSFVAAFVGDIMYQRCNTCSVYMFEALDPNTGVSSGAEFVFDLQQPYSSSSTNFNICGTYTAGVTVGHFVPGSIEDYGGGYYMPMNSYYNTPDYMNYALIVRGTVVVEKESDGTYVFDINTVDDKGNAIKGIFRGKGEFIDW